MFAFYCSVILKKQNRLDLRALSQMFGHSYFFPNSAVENWNCTKLRKNKWIIFTLFRTFPVRICTSACSSFWTMRMSISIENKSEVSFSRADLQELQFVVVFFCFRQAKISSLLCILQLKNIVVVIWAILYFGQILKSRSVSLFIPFPSRCECTRVMISFCSPYFCLRFAVYVNNFAYSFSNYAQKMFSFSVLDRFNFSRVTRLETHFRLENHQCVTKMQRLN